MKKWIHLFVGALLLMLIGCGTNTDEANVPNPDNSNAGSPTDPGIKGYVVEKDEDGRLLVISPTPQDFSATGGISEFYDAIWFSGIEEDIEIGEKVEVWFDAVAQSYPGQAGATKISIIETKKPEEAHLTEAEAIQKAISDLDTEGIIVFLSTEFDRENDVWIVKLKQDDDELSITVWDSELPEVPVKELETEFLNRLYKEILVDEQTRQVLEFHSKEEWINYMAEITDEKLAQYHADNFYQEEDGELYLIPRGGPVNLTLDKPWETKQITDTVIQVVQTDENMLHGKYTLTITYEFKDNHWIIQNRETELIN